MSDLVERLREAAILAEADVIRARRPPQESE